MFQAHFCGTKDLFNRMKHKSLCMSVKEKFSAFSQRLDLICVSTDGSVFWLSVCDTAKRRVQLQNNCIHQNTLISDTFTLVASALLCVSQFNVPGYKIVFIFSWMWFPYSEFYFCETSILQHKRTFWGILESEVVIFFLEICYWRLTKLVIVCFFVFLHISRVWSHVMLKDGAQFIAFNIILMFFGFFIPVSNNDILYVSIGKYPT